MDPPAKMCPRFALLLLLGSACATLAASAQHSCMVRTFLKSGMPLRKAVHAESTLRDKKLPTKLVMEGHPTLLSLILDIGVKDIEAVQSCFRQTNEQCQNYTPCANGGACQLSLSATEYICKCPLDYAGQSCEIPHPAPIAELRALEKKVQQLEETLATEVRERKKKTRHLGDGCNLRNLGYKYQSRHAIQTEQDSGEIARISFRKKHENTVVRLLYSSNIRTLGALTAARWYFLIDGEECAKPSKIDIGMFQSDGGNTHVPAVLLGICETTDGGRIGAGNHTVTVMLGQLPNHSVTNAMSRWDTTTLFEVQEMCPQFGL